MTQQELLLEYIYCTPFTTRTAIRGTINTGSPRYRAALELGSNETRMFLKETARWAPTSVQTLRGFPTTWSRSKSILYSPGANLTCGWGAVLPSPNKNVLQRSATPYQRLWRFMNASVSTRSKTSSYGLVITSFCTLIRPLIRLLLSQRF